ncbi:hypothetical protein AB670_01756 [Chryseobacterium sp. MOF25P]|uniref:hypothetical protein n=1 Tax=unclassified Chryseobacterium TaxID=2593645 RepID=UPI000805D2B3|nr:MULTISPECIES: hypothetical protein [unclassified Chryseobacterium]OBW41941.1 hypothetical protein AB670_01756 [Chryseobacterium sp. MOF25P]OBW45052.1 hypothetical protein AB671_02781 [Chryseobacterium sp. BGARF1]
MKQNFNVIYLFLAFSCFYQCEKKQEKASLEKAENTDSFSKKETLKIVHSETDSISEKVKAFITSEYLSQNDLKTISENDRKFQFFQIDLNNDGLKETFVNFLTPYFCGTGGCSMFLLDNDFKAITKFTVMRTPLYLSTNTENGWKIVYVKDRDGFKQLVYKNKKYPSNPSILPVSKQNPENEKGTILIFENNLNTYQF